MSVQRRPAKGLPKGGGRPKWVVRYRDPSGRERSKTFPYTEYDKPAAAAEAYDDEQARLLRRHEWVDEDGAPTLAEVWALWESSATTPGTTAVRKLVGRNLGDLATTKITKIRPSQLRAWQAEITSHRPWMDTACKKDEGISSSTALTWWTQLSGCLSLAVIDGLLLVNPCSKVSGPPQVVAVDPKSLPTLDEIADAVTRATETGRDTISTMIIVALSTGMRGGEVGGLCWEDIDRTAGTISITRQVRVAAGGGTEWGPLKTASSRRIVPVPPETMKRLLEYRLVHPRQPGEPMFRRPNGAMWSSAQISDATRNVTKGKFRFHALRHAYASGLIRQGRGVKAVQKMVGHASAATTIDTYTHM